MSETRSNVVEFVLIRDVRLCGSGVEEVDDEGGRRQYAGDDEWRREADRQSQSVVLYSRAAGYIDGTCRLVPEASRI
jgi:hypothetical protein